MKKNFLFAMVFGMIAVGVSSCSDDKNSDEPGQPSVAMVLTEMRGNYVNVSYNTDDVVFQAKYDAQGRITETRIGEDGNWEKYVYTDSKITCGSSVYEVSDGKIVDGDEYKYDSSNQLTAIGNCSLTWTGGNITATSYSGSWGNEKTSLTYTDKPNVGNLNWMLNLAYSTCFPAEMAYVEPELAVSGYFGVPCKNLCKSITLNGELDRTFDYLDYNENGYPTTLKITDADGDIQEYSLTWTKL